MARVAPLDLIDQSAAVLVDLDGCLLSGDKLALGARELVDRAGERLVIVSNNSTATAREMSAVLGALGAQVPPARIVLAGALAVETIAADWPGARVLALATPAIGTYAEEQGLRLDDAEPEVVLVCRDLDLSYARLARAAQALAAGAALVASNPDGAHPDGDGAPVPETGALMAALTAIVPAAAPRVIGKPQPAMFMAALSRVGARPWEAVMIGDNPRTDRAGAALIGIASLLVGPAPEARARSLAALLDPAEVQA